MNVRGFPDKFGLNREPALCAQAPDVKQFPAILVPIAMPVAMVLPVTVAVGPIVVMMIRGDVNT